MAIHLGVGTSHNLNSRMAGVEAAKDALLKAGRPKADCAIILSSSAFNPQEVLSGVREASGAAAVAGCSTSGEIISSGPQDRSVIVLVLASDDVRFHPVKAESISKDMQQAGRAFAEQVRQKSGGKAKLTFIFSDPLSGNGTELVRGIFDVLGNSFPLLGGAAGDDMKFKKTFQYFNDQVLTDAAVGIALEGDFQCRVGADHGWQPIGNPRTVTKAKGTVLYELDGKPAFDLYRQHFGARADDFKEALSIAAVTYPMGMKVKEDDKIMIRVPLGVGADGSIACGAEVLEKSQIYLMIGTVSSATWASKGVAEKIHDAARGANPKLIFLSNCVARKVLMGDHCRKEVQAIQDLLGRQAEVFGFYSYGQIAPFSEKKINVKFCDPGFYEQSCAIGLLGD